MKRLLLPLLALAAAAYEIDCLWRAVERVENRLDALASADDGSLAERVDRLDTRVQALEAAAP